MVTRLLYNSYRFFSQLKLSKNNLINMDKCFFRHLQDSQIHITFMYKINEANQRQFNFNRKSTETVQVLLNRIAANVMKALNKKKKGNDGQVISESDFDMYEGDSKVRSEMTCEELLSKNTDIQLKVGAQYYKIIVDAPWVTSVSLPLSLLSGFPIYPVHLELLFADVQQSTFNWYIGQHKNSKGNEIADVHIDWKLTGCSYTYVPTTKDVGLKIKLECVPGNGTTTGPAVDTISTGCVEAGPGRCPYENRHAFTQNRLTDRSFRVVSYNILADLYCDSDFTRTALHPYCPPYALHIDYRKQLVLAELLGYNADIMCLQEVDRKIFNYVLQPILDTVMYDGAFTQKGKEVAEGLACFYRRDRFRLLSKETLILAKELETSSSFTSIWNTIKSNEQLVSRILDRSTAAQATVLQSVEHPEEVLVVGNTHLYFHPDADHIRLIQGGMVIYWLSDILKATKEKLPGSRISLILCGDFNSVPSCGVYQLYTSGIAPSSLDDWKSNALEAVQGLTLQQDIELGSACGTPEFTNFTAGFADCLDYIFYQKENIALEQVIPLPSVEELKEHTALPSVVFPSDHIALVADLSFKQ